MISKSAPRGGFDPYADPYRGHDVIDRSYSADELRAVIAQVEGLVGDTLDDLVERHRRAATSPATPPGSPHRLVELLLRLRRAADHPDDGLAESAAAVAIAEVGGIIEIFEAWRSDPAWPEFQQAVQDPRNYLHAVTTLSVATALKEHHPKTELVASSTPGPSADLRMVVSDEHGLAVEVKTSLSLGQRSRSMSPSEAVDFINGVIKDASSGFKRQLEKGFGVLNDAAVDTDIAPRDGA